MRGFSRLVPALFALGLAWAPATAQTRAADGPRSFADAPMIGFGTVALVAGGEIFVGRPGESSLFPMPGSEPGSVHAFRRTDAGWEEYASLTGSGAGVGDGFGSAIAASDGFLLVGAPGEDEGRGAAYVYRSLEGTWSEVARIQPEGLLAGAAFGTALAARDSILLVGAPGRGASGAVFVYRGEVEAPVELTAEDAGADARFGSALSLADGKALIGAPGPFGVGGVAGAPPAYQPGSAYVYAFDAEADVAWTREARLVPAAGGSFGVALLLHEGAAFVGAPIANQAAGSVTRFERGSSGEWSLSGQVAPTAPQPQTLFGHSIAAAGEAIVVGAPLAGGGAGSAYVFDPSGNGAWTESQVVSEDVRGLMGFYGNTVAGGEGLFVIGAPAAEFFEGIGYVYRREGSRWVTDASLVEAAGGLAPVTGGEQRCSDDGEVAGFPCQDVELVSFMPASAVGGQRGVMVSDLWGWTDPDTRREYAILGRFDGTSFIDVTDAENPVYLGNLPLTDGASPNLWRDMKVYANHAFIVADNAGQHGVQVFDLTRLRDVSQAPVDFDEDAHYDGIASAHNIVINEASGFAYVVGGSGGGETCGGALHIIDIRDPRNPTFAGCYADNATGTARTGYTHDAQCVVYHGPDEDYTGREVCFNASETALGIGDVTDKDNPAPIANASYPNVAYSHQGWLSEDHRYFYLNDELDELSGGVVGTRTLVWDVQDLDDPVLATEYMSENQASDHNLYIRGQFMYQSNYVSGLRVFDISDPVNPKPVGFFDTVPGGADAPGFAGSWSNYPFFESGIIVVSSMREGLFILKKRQPQLVP